MMLYQGTFVKFYASGDALEHGDNVIGFERANGRWDQQSGYVSAHCATCGESPEYHSEGHEPAWEFFLDYGEDALDIEPDATYVIFRPTTNQEAT